VKFSQVHGIVQDRNGKILSTMLGKWDDSMYCINGDYSGKGKGYESMSDAHLIWKRSKPPKFPTRYNFTRFAITLNELTAGLKVSFLTYTFSCIASLFSYYFSL